MAWLGNVSLGPLCVLGGMLGGTYATLDGSDKKALKDLAGLVAVADVLEGLGGVLAADVEEDFFTAGVLVYEAWGAEEWSADCEVGVGGCSGRECLWFCWDVEGTYWCSHRPSRG